jgi:cell division septum initiation protein DivIVA
MQNIERQRNSAINTLNTRRSVLAGIGKVQQGATDATLGLDVADAKQKIANEQGLMRANTQLANFKDKEWDWNKRQKFEQDRQYAMSLLGSGNQNMLNSLDRLGAGAGYLLASKNK